MDASTRLVADVTVATLTAAAGGFAMRAIRIPPVVGYLLAGLVVGPFTGGYVANTESLSGLGEVGLIFLVFGLGLSFSPAELRRIGAKPLLLNGVALAVVGVAAWIIALVVRVPHPITVALVIPVSSTAVGIALLSGMGIGKGAIARIAIAMLVAQDLLAVVALVLVSTPIAALSIGDLAIDIGKAVLFVAAALLFGATILHRAVRAAIARTSSELLIPALVALALAAAWLGHFAGLSLEFGAFVGGAVISEAAGSRAASAIVAPFRELFVMWFFVSLGMLLDVRAAVALWPEIVGIGAALVAIRIGVWYVAGRALPLRASGAFALAVALLPMGEFNMVLASAALGAQRLRGSEFALLAGVMFVSIVAGAAATPLLRTRVDERPASGEPMGLTNDVAADVLVIGYGRVGAIAARLFARAGRRSLVIEPDAGACDRAVRDGFEVLRLDGTDPTALDRTVGPETQLVVTTIPDTHANATIAQRLRARGVPVVARAVRNDDAPLLREAGALESISPETEGAYDLARAGLRSMNFTPDEIEEYVATERAKSLG